MAEKIIESNTPCDYCKQGSNGIDDPNCSTGCGSSYNNFDGLTVEVKE
jgi:hypothetical protein